MTQSDFQFALLLQQQFEHEANIDRPTNNLSYDNKKTAKEKSLVDPSWELIDPTPNIYNLFVAFNEKYFWNKLQAVCIEWSKRMTSCAGICYYSGRGGLCRISLSAPLLKLRPRKDLIETMLHEMIHAYLFITANNKDRDGHGPEFHKHMYRINNEAGTNISVYHDFIDEVRLYQQHWWRCNGPCQHRKPYFGMVRRATNRAPGPNDRWWDEHLRICGGNFIKVKEPEKIRKTTVKIESNKNNNIRKYFPVLKETTNNLNNNHNSMNNSNIVGFDNFKGKSGTATRTNSNGTIVVTKKPVQSTTTSKPNPIRSTAISPNHKPMNSSNIVGFDNFKDKSNTVTQKHPSETKVGTKNCVPNRENASIISKPNIVMSTKDSSIPANRSQDNDDYARVRNHWINKYSTNSTIPAIKRNISSEDDHKCTESDKRHKPNNDHEMVKCPICCKEFKLNDINSHLDTCLESVQLPQSSSKQHNSGKTSPDYDYSIDKANDDLDDLIPCLVCDKIVLKVDLSSHLDDCMGDDNIFTINETSDSTESYSNVKGDDTEKKYNCPVCSKMFFVNEMSNHLNTCLVDDNIFYEPF